MGLGSTWKTQPRSFARSGKRQHAGSYLEPLQFQELLGRPEVQVEINAEDDTAEMCYVVGFGATALRGTPRDIEICDRTIQQGE